MEHISAFQGHALRLAHTIRHVKGKAPSMSEHVIIPKPAPFSSSNIELKEENFLNIETLLKNPGKVMAGKVLICKTIAPAYKTVPLYTLVEDSTGSEVVPLVLYNFYPGSSCPDMDVDGVLPIGSYLAVKNLLSAPWTNKRGRVEELVRVDSPADVEFLSEKWIKEQFPYWESYSPSAKELQLVESLSYPAPFWERIPALSDQERAKALARFGNAAFVCKNLAIAIRFYDLSLAYDRTGLTLTNKAAALMGLKCWQAGLQCLLEAEDKGHCDEKVVFRKGKCLAQLSRYNESIKWLEDKLLGFQGNKVIKNLLNDVRMMSQLSKDPKTLNSILWKLHFTNDLRCEQVPEYKGPIVIAPIPGKGGRRGMIAKEDLVPGQLILVAKTCALATLKPNQREPHYCCKRGRFGFLLFDDIVSEVANKLHFDPSLAKEVYSLTAGKELGHLDGDFLGVDITRITGIVGTNACQTESDGKIPSSNCKIRNGLCLPMSYFNWTCAQANCHFHTVEEVEYVRVMQPVKKGDELLLNPLTGEADYEARKAIYMDKGFVCYCSLCRTEATESPQLRNKRKNFLKKLHVFIHDTPRVNMSVRRLEEIMRDLETLLKTRAMPQDFQGLDLAKDMVKLAVVILRVFGNYFQAITMIQRIFYAARAATAYDRMLDAALNILRITAEEGSKESEELLRLFLPHLKEIVVTYWGSLEPIRYSDPDIPASLKEKFDIDFLN